MGLLITFYIQWQRQLFFGPQLKKKRELGGTRFINKACILYKRLLGTSGVIEVQSKLRRSKFIQMEEWCPQYINTSSWYSGLGAGLSPWSHGFTPCFIRIFFSTGLTILALLTSSWTHNKLYSMLLAGIFPAKQNQQKIMECSKIKIKSYKPVKFVFLALWEP